jgi:hypothetical protein
VFLGADSEVDGRCVGKPEEGSGLRNAFSSETVSLLDPCIAGVVSETLLCAALLLGLVDRVGTGGGEPLDDLEAPCAALDELGVPSSVSDEFDTLCPSWKGLSGWFSRALRLRRCYWCKISIWVAYYTAEGRASHAGDCTYTRCFFSRLMPWLFLDIFRGVRDFVPNMLKSFADTLTEVLHAKHGQGELDVGGVQ